MLIQKDKTRYIILKKLSEKPYTLCGLAEEIGLTYQAIQTEVRRLLNFGLVYRSSPRNIARFLGEKSSISLNRDALAKHLTEVHNDLLGVSIL